ncbi:hypothetical protein [Christiangramia sediminis]|uniref:Uncharacterized protein n=1 Tax=Christiangramia sediminis TaxID=2881336 RepID=A0A9X1LHE4_9FLAO|nr:hypothetical protein [Christiangramia sediminis]MCB7480434.1 hypothetical protein [Christiangramia sediminis]
MNNTNYLLLSLFFVFSGSLLAQNDAAYLLLDHKIGLENTMLFNGIQNLDQEVTINEKNKFLYTYQDFNVSSIVYENNYYPSVLLKFNVYDDLVLAKIPVSNKFSTFQLITSRIQKFEMNGHKFENIGIETEKDFEGFYENILETSSLTLFKKHRKKVQRKMERNYVFYEFEPTDSEFIFKYEGEFFSADSKKEINSIFPTQKSEIKKFYREQRSVLRAKPDDFMIQLFKEITSQLEKSS